MHPKKNGIPTRETTNHSAPPLKAEEAASPNVSWPPLDKLYPHSQAADLRRQAEELFQKIALASPKILESKTPEAYNSILHELRVHQIQLEMQNEELHRTQEELAASQARFFDLYELAPVGYVTVNEPGLIQQINLSAAALLGLPKRPPIHQPITHVIFHEDQNTFDQARMKLLETGEIQTCDLRMARDDGMPVWVHVTLTTARDAAGAPEFRLAFSDITERKRTEAALDAEHKLLRENEAFQRDILNSLPAHIAVLERTGTILAVNEPWLRFGRENGNSDVKKIGVGANYIDVCRASSCEADAYAKAAADGVETVLAGMLPRFTLEYPCDTPEGAHWFKMEVIPLAGKDGGALVTHTDINERKQAQRLLAWEKSALESIVGAAAPGQVLDRLMHGLETELPGALCSVLLLDADGIHLRLGAAPSLPDDYNRAVDGIAIGTAVGSCGTAVYEKREVITSDIGNDPLWVDYRDFALGHGLRACWSTPIHCSQKKILGTLAIYHREPHYPTAAELEVIGRAVHVISIAIERQKAEGKILQFKIELEQRVEKRTAELQTANASLTDFKAALDEHAMVSITDTDGIITYANDKFCLVSQYSREELIGQNHSIVKSGYHSKEFFREFWNTILSGRIWKGEIKNRAKDGSFYWSSNTVVPFLGEGGKPMQYIAIRTDISKRKQAEERIGKLNAALESRAAELESTNHELESFTYSVSHDLRTPLRAVDGFSHMVIKHYADKLDDEGRRKLGVIRSEAQRMGRLIDDLLAFSRLVRQPIDPMPINMETMAREVFDELSTHKPERKLRLNLQKLPPAFGSESLIRQVWVNLIGNAIKFTDIREDGQIEIGTLDGTDGGPIYYIKDNGAGFDMRYADKLFGVFQRLHSQEEFSGTGVGLALVQRIIMRHGGRVWAEAEIDRGATFHFTLPNKPE
ncbi:MAG: PAS domain S-box protein [Verrucomicrobiota bacterium]